MGLLAACCCETCISGATGACCLQYYVPGHTSGFRPAYLFSEFIKEGCTIGCSGCIDNISECECNIIVDTLNKEDPIKGFRKFDGSTAHGPVIVVGDWYNTTGVTFTSLFPSICDAVYPASQSNNYNMSLPDPDPTGPTPFLGCKSFCSCEIPSSPCTFSIYAVYSKETYGQICMPYDGDCCCSPGSFAEYTQLVGIGSDWSEFPAVYNGEMHSPEDPGTTRRFRNPNYIRKTKDCIETECPNGDFSFVEAYYKSQERTDSVDRYTFKREFIVAHFGPFPVGGCPYEVTIKNLLTSAVSHGAGSQCQGGCDSCCGAENQVPCTYGEGYSGYRPKCDCCPGSSTEFNMEATFKIPRYGSVITRSSVFMDMDWIDCYECSYQRGGGAGRGEDYDYCPFSDHIDCDGTSPDPISHTIEY